MKIFTLNVGQGQFAVVTGENEAFIIDTYVPLDPKQEIVHVKAALSKILKGKNLVGPIVTGFDSDHFNEVGMKIVLNTYLPDWIMYPKYYKKTKTADACFDVIDSFKNRKDFRRYPVSLDNNDHRFYYKLSNEFVYEVFSPHRDDMTSSNNCSLVCKVTERLTGATYLITGDTENDRWDSIVRYFGSSISAHVLDAPHHGSKNGISKAAISKISPHTVLISAGVQNQYGHPDKEATVLFSAYAKQWYSTNYGTGQSLETHATGASVQTFLFKT